MKRFIATLAMAGAAGAIVLAPVAAAAPTGAQTTNNGGATIVQTPGNSQVTVQPGAAAVHQAARNRRHTHTGHPVTDQRGAEPARLTDRSGGRLSPPA